MRDRENANDSWANWPAPGSTSDTSSESTDEATDTDDVSEGSESPLLTPESEDSPDVSRGTIAWRLRAYAVWVGDSVPGVLRDEPASVSLVYLIVKREGPCSASLVLDKGLALGTVYGALDTLEGCGLVERCPNPLHSRTRIFRVPGHHEHPLERFDPPKTG
jgi:hypothetical protein